ncbi:hypothetical protein HDU93_000515 [Gonapodya sp. JEL0774]|nr:hypothetical protein HDU93_000515 [Gonapodya sp. JEL0774]
MASMGASKADADVGSVPAVDPGAGTRANPAGPGSPIGEVALWTAVIVIISAIGWFLFWFLVMTKCGRRPLRRIQRGARRGLNIAIIQSLPVHPYDPSRRSGELKALFANRATFPSSVGAPAERANLPETVTPDSDSTTSGDALEIVVEPSSSTPSSTRDDGASGRPTTTPEGTAEDRPRTVFDRIRSAFKFANAVARISEAPPPSTDIAMSNRGNTTEGSAADAPTVPQPDSCVICLCNFVEEVPLRVLPCFHEFHPECIDPWLLDLSARCPLCKANVAEMLGCIPDNDQSSEEVYYYADLRELFVGPVVSLWRTIQSRA